MLAEERKILLKEFKIVFLSNYTSQKLEEQDEEYMSQINDYIDKNDKGLLEGRLASGKDPIELKLGVLQFIGSIVSRFKNEKNAKKLILSNEFGLMGNLIYKYLKDYDKDITKIIKKYDRMLTRDAYKRWGLKAIEFCFLENNLEAMATIIELNKTAVDKVGISLWKEKEFYKKLAKISPMYLSRGEYKILEDGTQMKDDRDLIMELVKINPMSIAFVPYKYKKDYEIVHEAIKQNGHTLMYASPELQDNKQLVYEAVSKCGLSLSYASNQLRNDMEICMRAVESSEYAIRYVGDKVLKEVQKKCRISRKPKEL